MCEKCWAAAGMRALHLGGSKVDHYYQILEEKKDNPCSPREQSGEWWDEERQIDRRTLVPRPKAEEGEARGEAG